jgi:SAM-dependent methyltransferase
MSHRHYASTGIGRSLRQILHALRSDDDAVAKRVSVIAQRLRCDEARIANGLGREFKGLNVLIIGPGPFLVEPRFFGRRNSVTAIDLDVIPSGFAPGNYIRMLRQNGVGRLAKTLGRKVLGVDRRHRYAWQHELGTDRLPEPELIQGDILQGPPRRNAFDVVACWAVFQHLSNPGLAIQHMNAALRPGGVVYFHVHLYTSNTGHHDIRAFTGAAADLPPWGHLRPATEGQVTPSAWLNRWRLRDWRKLLNEEMPGFEEYRETYDNSALALLSPEIRSELSEFDDEELLTYEVFFLWQKPKA